MNIFAMQKKTIFFLDEGHPTSLSPNASSSRQRRIFCGFFQLVSPKNEITKPEIYGAKQGWITKGWCYNPHKNRRTKYRFSLNALQKLSGDRILYDELEKLSVHYK